MISQRDHCRPRSVLKSARRMGLRLLLALVSVGLSSLPAAAQEGNVKESPLFQGARDPKIVALQVRTALPAYEQGLALLNESQDADVTARGVKYLIDAYHYLRGAWQSAQLILTTSKFPDPLLEVQRNQIMDIRNRLIDCTSRREHLAGESAIRTACVDGLNDGLRKLRIVSATLP